MPLPNDVQENERRKVLEFFLMSFAGDLGELAGVRLTHRLKLADQHLPILDLDGTSLFDSIDIVDDEAGVIGSVRTSASRRDLPLIDSITLGKPSSTPEFLIERAHSALLRDIPNAEARDPVFVCYGYPYIGIRFTVQIGGDESYFLYDPYKKRLVSRWTVPNEITEIETNFRSGSPEGEPIYSINGHLAESGTADSDSDRQWSSLYLETIRLSAELAIAHGSSIGRRRELSLANLASEFLSDDARIHDLGNRIRVQGDVLPVELIPQEESNYCALACVQMILEYIGRSEGITQQQLAAELGTTSRGTDPDVLGENLGRLSGNLIDVSTLDKPSFEQIVEAFGPLPLKSGIRGHARVIRGWKRYAFLGSDGRPSHTEEFFVVNDPQPVGSGLVVLESAVKPVEGFHTNAAICRYAT